MFYYQVSKTNNQVQSSGSIFGKITRVHDNLATNSNHKGQCTCPRICSQCGKPCTDNAKNCYNTPNQHARYKQYLEYLDRLQGKSSKRV